MQTTGQEVPSIMTDDEYEEYLYQKLLDGKGMKITTQDIVNWSHLLDELKDEKANFKNILKAHYIFMQHMVSELSQKLHQDPEATMIGKFIGAIIGIISDIKFEFAETGSDAEREERIMLKEEGMTQENIERSIKGELTIGELLHSQPLVFVPSTTPKG